MLGRLLARAVNDVSSQDLHDRALLYHRLMRHDPEVARRVCCCERPPLAGEFAEDRDTGGGGRGYAEGDAGSRVLMVVVVIDARPRVKAK